MAKRGVIKFYTINFVNRQKSEILEIKFQRKKPKKFGVVKTFAER